MKKIFITMMGLMLALGSTAQFIRASIQKSTTDHSVDVLFKSTYTSVAAEALNFLQLQVSIPAAVATNVTAYITPLNNFASIGPTGFQAITPFVESSTGEKIYGWVYANPSGPAMPIWTNGVEFIGARITFNGNPAAVGQLVSLLDLSLLGGGDNGQYFFGIATNQPPNDKTDYAAMFYQNAGISTTGTYGSGDQFVITNQIVTLPIDLLTFSGYKDGTRNQLKWTTSTEQNNMGFDVQRSLDGVNYNSIGFVNSLANGGNSSVQLNYAFTDNNVTGLRQYYRLRQVDFDGRSKISNIVLLKSDKPALITLDGFFPNPATTTINMLVGAPAKDKITVVVNDMAGRAMITRNMNVETGSNTLPLDISALAGGSYVIKLISSDGEVVTGRFVKH